MPKTSTILKRQNSKAAKRKIGFSISRTRKGPIKTSNGNSYQSRYSNTISYLHSLEENEYSIMIASSSNVASLND